MLDAEARLEELQALADQVVDEARPGEQIEAFVARGGDTDVRIYEGEVEHFVSRAVGGHRHPRDRATAAPASPMPGTLDADAVAEVLAEARDNVQFGTLDEWAGLAEPDGVAVTAQEFWNEELEHTCDRAQDRARQGARTAHARRRPPGPRRRLELRRRLGRGGRCHHHRHPPVRTRERLLRHRVDARRRRRRDPDRVRLLRRPGADEFDLDKASRRGRRSRHPAARRHQARRAGASPWCSTRS